jgi:hypothetical protein
MPHIDQKKILDDLPPANTNNLVNSLDSNNNQFSLEDS